MFDRQNVRRDTDIGARERRWMLLERWCSGTLRNVFDFDMPIFRDVQEIACLRRLLRLIGNFENTCKFSELNLCCFEDSIDGFYLMTEADTW